RMAKGQQAPQVGVAIARAWRAFLGALATQGPGPPAGEKWLCVLPPKLERFPLPLAEAPPRCGGTLGGVTRPKSTLAPRMRQAPDGGKSGGNQPPGSQRDHPSSLRVPTLPMDTWLKEKRRQTSEKLLPTLDIGSHINAAPQPRPEACATQ